ncbi:class I SAM-dependent methyltransferase [Paenibacillus sp. GSMTC-2017]|uniref:class I SAM-dependent methyltransferase n=1 Tax=Paenibacillus sp. GSMTC-2017 TaxID=2794350 RepID=UPI0018D951B7|nr:class I SAM-dependent methyltransferase [Paenibacillus sp. GSMTC-2017]MBH5319048.1 class I SAM-dependent methyltransferase [Paenibacillus sp. GSMTC-2017]
MNELDYRTFYDAVGKENGWDFSKLKCVTDGVAWDFYDEVVKRCKKSDLLLDIGTGGGEAVLSISDSALLLLGVDNSKGMIDTALNNLNHSDKANVRFLHMDAEHLDFPNTFFNIVSCRHSGFNSKEVAKVLANDGVFFTQQVAEDDKINLKEAFGRGQALGIEAGTLQGQYIAELNEAGFSQIQSFEYNSTDYYETAEDLIFLLKHTPIIPNFGQDEADFQVLEQFIAHNQTDRGIRTNSSRFMLIARK